MGNIQLDTVSNSMMTKCPEVSVPSMQLYNQQILIGCQTQAQALGDVIKNETHKVLPFIDIPIERLRITNLKMGRLSNQ